MSIKPRHRIAALWRIGMNPNGRVWAARGARGPLSRLRQYL